MAKYMWRRRKNWYNNHHIIARSREKDWFNVEHEDNQLLMKQKKHERIHWLHDNKTPREQLIECLQWNEKVINEWVYSMLMEILTIEKEEFYKTHLLR